VSGVNWTDLGDPIRVHETRARLGWQPATGLMNCREAIDVLADYLDATLTPDVLAHLGPTVAYARRVAPIWPPTAVGGAAATVNRVEMPTGGQATSPRLPRRASLSART